MNTGRIYTMQFQKEHVQAAFKIIEQHGFAPNRDSTKWDIIDPLTGNRFPPKAVLRIAKKLAGDTSFSGGGGPHTNQPLRARGFEISLKLGLEESAEFADIRDIIGSSRDETTKERLVNARLGQGGFREALIEIWGAKCAVTGCSVSQVLRASHIKPWRVSSDFERLDPANGILLSASIDALFDKFIITFAPDGRVIAAASVELEDFQRVGLTLKERLSLSPENEHYMNWHRAEFCKKYGLEHAGYPDSIKM